VSLLQLPQKTTIVNHRESRHSIEDWIVEKQRETDHGEHEDVEHLKKLCDFLRSRQGPPIREALLMDKRVHYLKGTSFLTARLSF
jgi:hypothetical protein